MVPDERKQRSRPAQTLKHHQNKKSISIKKKGSEKKLSTKQNQKKTKKKQTTPKTGVQWESTTQQAKWLTELYDSKFGSSLSELERTPPLSESSFVQLQQDKDRDSEYLELHVKHIFGEKWKDALCSENDCNKEKGSPSLLILCSSALRCVELLKGLRNLTKNCKPGKLFAKHIKVEEQVAALQNHVNIAVGTPNRVKKLIDIGALNLGSLSIILIDMCVDAKGFNIITIPQIKDDFWELYKTYFHQEVLNEKHRLCLY